MAIGPIIGLASSYVQSLLTGGVNGSAALASKPAGNNTVSVSTTPTQDTNQLSPFAQLLGTLQELQETNPAQYQHVTQQISNNLQAWAQSSTTAGNTNLANQLQQLSADFQTASSTGQLPNVQDLAQAVGHGHYSRGRDPGHLLQSVNQPETGSTAAASENALTIIDGTLTSAGVSLG